MSAATLAGLSDQLLYLAVLSYLVAVGLFGAELALGRGWLGRAGLGVTVAGLAANAGCALTRALATDRVPWGNMYEYSVMLGAVVVTGFLAWAARRPEVRPLGAFFLVPAVLAIGAGRIALYAEAGPLVPALESGWLRVHVFAAITGSALLTLASVFSVLYLVAERLEGRAAPPRPPLIGGAAATADPDQVEARRSAIAGHVAEEEAAEGAPPTAPAGRRLRLPAARVLDDLAYRTTAVAFPIWTFAIIAGAIWGQSAWGRYWGWDPKETWSFVVWVIYAAYLHARATAGWRGRGAAWIAVAGLAAMIFNFYVVNTVLIGLHSYSGL